MKSLKEFYASARHIRAACRPNLQGNGRRPYNNPIPTRYIAILLAQETLLINTTSFTHHG